ncbi:MAG: hypothetical protein KC910_27485, partial [Candidatus Eremiobacteraeota bacterium]|nr:hypothetical protein [Candidatus Eremiobacteraeota bacterium]
NTIFASNVIMAAPLGFIDVHTETNQLTATANTGVVVRNVGDLSSLYATSLNGDVVIRNEGDVFVDTMTSGAALQLFATGDILTVGPGYIQAGTNVALSAGGVITPLNGETPLDVDVGGDITVTTEDLFNGTSVTFTGSVVGSVFIGAGTPGKVFFNGVDLTFVAPIVDPPIDPGVIDDIGSNGNLDTDTGSSGGDSSPTPTSPTDFIGQLNDLFDEDLNTSLILNLSIDEYGDIKVTLQKPSPYDQELNHNEDMSADDLLDLDIGEMGDVKVSLYYDPASDRIIMALDLSADALLDLGIDEMSEIPVNLKYELTKDPKMMDENLSADDVLDLDVAEYGELPITLILVRDPLLNLNELLNTDLQKLAEIPVSLAKLASGEFSLDLILDLNLAELGEIPIKEEDDDDASMR